MDTHTKAEIYEDAQTMSVGDVREYTLDEEPSQGKQFSNLSVSLSTGGMRYSVRRSGVQLTVSRYE